MAKYFLIENLNQKIKRNNLGILLTFIFTILILPIRIKLMKLNDLIDVLISVV